MPGGELPTGTGAAGCSADSDSTLMARCPFSSFGALARGAGWDAERQGRRAADDSRGTDLGNIDQ